MIKYDRSAFCDMADRLYLSLNGGFLVKHIKTVNKANLKETASKGGCGECQASCQSACKTSCTVANQRCEK